MKEFIIKAFLLVLFFTFLMDYALSDEKGAVTYQKNVNAIINKRCGSCHGSDSPTIDGFESNKEGFKQQKKGPRMETYENLLIFVNGKETGALMRRLDDGKNTKDGRSGNMYNALGGNRCREVAAFRID